MVKICRLKYLKGLEILGHDISELGKSVLLGLFVLFQGLCNTSPQDDHDLQQTGHGGHVLPQQRFSLLRSNSCINMLFHISSLWFRDNISSDIKLLQINNYHLHSSKTTLRPLHKKNT